MGCGALIEEKLPFFVYQNLIRQDGAYYAKINRTTYSGFVFVSEANAVPISNDYILKYKSLAFQRVINHYQEESYAEVMNFSNIAVSGQNSKISSFSPNFGPKAHL